MHASVVQGAPATLDAVQSPLCGWLFGHRLTVLAVWHYGRPSTRTILAVPILVHSSVHMYTTTTDLLYAPSTIFGATIIA